VFNPEIVLFPESENLPDRAVSRFPFITVEIVFVVKLLVLFIVGCLLLI
jgi:hypothetical protein